ncbi:hypothetical protein V5R04_14245 [Jonesiaceae bacterium BS-20]|uniref:Uncharacterized protein n=1 Tax=Jonesiaceae bacterium BS-20 TaxID=3120821 RepID=A0AAU7DU82_9MICO
MASNFKWVPDVDRGEWLRSIESEAMDIILSIVPRGYPAYARVFHPVTRDRPVPGKTWQDLDRATSLIGVQQSLVHEPTSWAQSAQSFVTVMHPAAQYHKLVQRTPRDLDGLRAPDGWRYSIPEEGNLWLDPLTALSAVLARHTATPNSGIAAIWEGHGGLVSSAGVFHLASAAGEELSSQPLDLAEAVMPDLPDLFTYAPLPEDQGERSRMNCLLGIDPTEPVPGTGVLSREIATGPKFGLHEDSGRSYFLFEVGATDLADPTWPSRAPWVDAEQIWVQSPNILWPDDRAWVLATEIDFDSTLIADSNELINELLQTPGLEARAISPNVNLTWAGDTLN